LTNHWKGDGDLRPLTPAEALLLDSAGFTEDDSASPGVIDEADLERVLRDADGTPGLDRVLALLPTDLHPASVVGFLSTPQPDISLDNRPASPLQWLRRGGDMAPVLALIEIANWTAT